MSMADDRIIKPSRYRRQHDEIERIAVQIADSGGEIGHPYRAEGLLPRLERRGDITAAQRAAGEEFARIFHTAHLDALQASDPSRVPGVAGWGVHGCVRSRELISEAMHALGEQPGRQSDMSSAIWHVVGLGMSVAEWARVMRWNGRRLNEEVAKGVLIAALGALELHLGGRHEGI